MITVANEFASLMTSRVTHPSFTYLMMVRPGPCRAGRQILGVECPQLGDP